MPLLGEVKVPVENDTGKEMMTAQVFLGENLNLLGRDWQNKLNPGWKKTSMLNQMNNSSAKKAVQLQQTLVKYAHAFKAQLRTMK